MINEISLKQFRNFEDKKFNFKKGVNIIVGSNGSGKTNLLEAIFMAGGNKPYRTIEPNTIMHNRSWARIEVKASTEERVLKIKKTTNGLFEKTININNQLINKITLSKKIPIVMFEPNHLFLFGDGPDVRRDYLDDLIEQTLPGYQSLRKQYRRVLAQRNKLLKQQPQDIKKLLFAWDVRLSELGGRIATQRHLLIAHINNKLPELYKKLSGDTVSVSVGYDSQIIITQYGSELLHRLGASLEKDLSRGYTTNGPHRDDMKVMVGGHPIGENASRGEVRTMLLCLKIIELDLVEGAHNKKPLFLLDDVFSELDASRRRILTGAMDGYQTFITTTDADIVANHFMNDFHVIHMSK